MTKLIDLADIQADPRAQPRTAISPDKIAEYVEDMLRGDNFPPLVVFTDGAADSVYWLGDGFHRYYAAKTATMRKFPCAIRPGGLREAILYSCGANAAHGVRRTTGDKRRAVAKLLDDKEWATWSDQEIARQCSVSHPFVSLIRKEHAAVTGNVTSEDRTYRTKHGTVSTMNTGPINADRKAEAVAPERLVSSLRELLRIVQDMPKPAELIARFPNEQRYHFPISELDVMARWMGELAQLWRENMRESA